MSWFSVYFVLNLSLCMVFTSALDASICSENCDPASGCDNITGNCFNCTDGWYGNTCNQSCSANCVGSENECHMTSGSCIKGCEWGWYGENCTEQCEENCSVCNRTNGICIACKTGFWGSNCKNPCNDNCQGCEIETGICQNCKSSFWGQYCSNDCANNCVSCNQSSGVCDLCDFRFYGVNCTEICGNCKYGICDKNGNCFQSECKEGWFGRKCDQACIANCSYCVDNETCSTCIDGLTGPYCSVQCPDDCRSCSDNRASCYMCRDSHKVPTRNCTCSNEKCIKYDIVSNLNECIECENGTGWFKTFGTCCPCPHCNGGIDQCSRNGNCLKGCEAGYYPDSLGCPYWCSIPHCVWCEQRYALIPDPACIGCEDGWYISDHICKKCSDRCLHNTCYNYTGICKYGCDQGWYGDDCSKRCDSNCTSCDRTDGTCETCPHGRWGTSCQELCPENCTVCSVDTGVCQFCRPGLYGGNCTETCENCKQSFCLTNTGRCLFGCREGWFGEKCENNCLPNCSSCENNMTCSSCIDGWGGDVCDVKCPDTCVGCSLGKYCDACKEGQKIPSFNCTCSDTKCTKFEYSSSKNTTVCSKCENGTGWFSLFDTCCPCLHCLGGPEKCLPSGKCEEGCEPGWYLEPFGCVERCDIPHCVWCEQRHGQVPDVVCVGCQNGWYISDHICKKCSDRCLHNTCYNYTGICKYGCDQGWYGDDCSKRCDSNCTSCDRTDGTCETCPHGRWGTSCQELCPENCTVCSVDTGVCQFCRPGLYGGNCTETCENCKQSFCLTNTGRCLFGCREGWFGEKCENNCLPNCSSCENNMTCSSCIDGWGGDVCDVKCPDTCVGCSLGKYCDACKEGQKIPSFNCTCSDTKCTKFEYSSSKNTTVCSKCENGTGWFSLFDTCCPCLHCQGGPEKCLPSGKCEEGCEPGWYLEPFGCVERCDIPHCVWCEQRHGQVPDVVCVGCQNGWYTKDHKCIPCSSNCSGSSCDNRTGICKYGCEAGWYGNDCSKQCDSDCTCNRTDGRCLECPPGSWGRNCDETCPANCNASLCHQSTGICSVGCHDGWFGERCNEACIQNCVTCVDNETCSDCLSGFGGNKCDVKCPMTCESCDKMECISCKDDFHIPKLKCACNHTKCTRYRHGDNQNICAECEKGTGWYLLNGTCCPCLHCLGGPDKCLSNGTCEEGCQPGWFSEIFGCAQPCNYKCGGSNSICDIKSGKCLNGCDRGWKGDFCDIPCDDKCLDCSNSTNTCNRCIYGTWGSLCEHDCANTCSLGCNVTNGFCTGCDQNIYGQYCQSNCSKYCVNNSDQTVSSTSCDSINGRCLNGCVPGWHGDLCDIRCNRNCLEDSCDRSSGECLSGCIDGWIGKYCSDKDTSKTDTDNFKLNTGAVVGGTIAGVFVLLIVGATTCFIIKRRSTKYSMD